MAYKFQLGDFAASGSILMEGKSTTTDDSIVRTDMYVSGNMYIAQAQEFFLDTDKDTSIQSDGDDTMKLTTGGVVGVQIENAAIAVGTGGAHALTLDSEGGAGTFKLKDNDAAALDIKESGNSYLKFVTTNSSEKVVVGQTISGSVDFEGQHSKFRQMTIGYDGAGGSEGHLKLGAGGDLQFAVFSDNGYMINNSAGKDLVFQVKDGEGGNITPMTVRGDDGIVNINKLSLSGSANVVTATAAELNVMDGGTSATATTVADADRLVLNDNGTMKQVAMTDFETYFESALDSLTNVVAVGTLDAGAISENFGNIDNGTSYIRSGGAWKVDVDLAAAPSTSQTVSGQAGAITFGAGADAGIGVHDDHLYIENNVDTKGIVFKAHDGSDQAEIASIDGTGMAFEDDKGIVFGSDDDVSIKYDEATSDTLLVTQNVEGAALSITYAADQHDDAGDAWAMSIAATGGKLSWLNDVASKGTMVEHFSITPNATAGNSVAAFAGDLTIGGDLTVSGDTVQVDVAKLTVEDPLIELARGQANTADTLDIGFVGKYGVGGTHKYSGLFRDANDSGKWKLFKDSQEDLTDATAINTGATGYAAATLVVGTLEASTIIGTLGKTIVSRNDSQLDNSGDGLQLASGDTLICSQDLGANRKVFLPANPAAGDTVEVKLKGIGAAGRVLAIEKGHDSQDIDGGDSIILESDYAAVTLVASTGGNSAAWRVF